MDFSLQIRERIENKLLLQDDLEELEQYFTNLDSNAIESLYASALCYRNEEVLKLIDRCMRGCQLQEANIIEQIYYCDNRKRREELRPDGYWCIDYASYKELSPEQKKEVQTPYINYLNRPYINRDVTEPSESGCIIL